MSIFACTFLFIFAKLVCALKEINLLVNFEDFELKVFYFLQVTTLTDENIELKTRVDRKETDLELLQVEIDHFEELLSKADLRQQLTPFVMKNGPLTTAVMAALRDKEATQTKVCTYCECKETKL